MPISADQNLLTHLEQLIRRDPARRGLIGTEREFGPLCPGHLGELPQPILPSIR